MTLQPAPMMFPDVEAWAVDYMRGALSGRGESYVQGVTVGARVPNPRGSRMVVFRRDGGRAQGLFDLPRLAVRVWADTEENATDLARLVAALLWAAPGQDDVLVRMEQLSGPSAIADDSGQPQRYSLYEAKMRGTALEGTP